MKFVVENEKKLFEKTWNVIEPKIMPGLSFGLIGELGAGKTTLVQYIAKKLGATEKVTSPTFLMQKKYQLRNQHNISALVHIDLYRMFHPKKKDLREFVSWLEDPAAVVFVEWADKITNQDYFDCIIKITPVGETSRRVDIKWN